MNNDYIYCNNNIPTYTISIQTIWHKTSMRYLYAAGYVFSVIPKNVYRYTYALLCDAQREPWSSWYSRLPITQHPPPPPHEHDRFAWHHIHSWAEREEGFDRPGRYIEGLSNGKSQNTQLKMYILILNLILCEIVICICISHLLGYLAYILWIFLQLSEYMPIRLSCHFYRLFILLEIKTYYDIFQWICIAPYNCIYDRRKSIIMMTFPTSFILPQ